MRIGLIIPCHPKHYSYIYNLLDLIDINEKEKDIYIVFSSESDYNIFEKKEKIKEIIIPEKTNTNSIVTYKKFFALEKLKNDEKYDYFIACDAEITIIAENFNEENILNKINKIYDNKEIYAGILNEKNKYYDLAKRITTTSTSIFLDREKLEKETEYNSLYFWWSDLPVYKREHLIDFFNRINYNNLNLYHFDHLIYLSYLILYHDFNIVNITPVIDHEWSLESYNTKNIENLEKLKSINYGFSYITKKLYDNNKEFLKNEGSFLLYHLDR